MNISDYAQCSRVSGLDGLEVLSAWWRTHTFSPHVHDFYALSLNLGGRGFFHCRREPCEATAGTCNLIGPDELHTGQATSDDGWSYCNLHIETAFLATLLCQLDCHPRADIRFKSPVVNDPILAASLACAFARISQSAARLEKESLLLSVMARLCTHHLTHSHSLSRPKREPTAVRKAKEWLDSNPEQDISIRSLADIANLSPYYLVRVFHRCVGMPPHRYQTNLRVLRARRMLIAGAPIAEVASAAGFYDQSHLNRCFKSTLGVTPGSYTERGGPKARRVQPRASG